jgi:hypothetical protein
MFLMCDIFSLLFQILVFPTDGPEKLAGLLDAAMRTQVKYS